jgi:hypothetical protein
VPSSNAAQRAMLFQVGPSVLSSERMRRPSWRRTLTMTNTGRFSLVTGQHTSLVSLAITPELHASDGFDMKEPFLFLEMR